MDWSMLAIAVTAFVAAVALAVRRRRRLVAEAERRRRIERAAVQRFKRNINALVEDGDAVDPLPAEQAASGAPPPDGAPEHRPDPARDGGPARVSPWRRGEGGPLDRPPGPRPKVGRRRKP